MLSGYVTGFGAVGTNMTLTGEFPQIPTSCQGTSLEEISQNINPAPKLNIINSI